MPLRKYILTKGEIYHVYNKSVADEEIFRQTRNLNFSLDLIDYYLKKPRLRQKIAREGHRWVRKNYSMKRQINKLLAIMAKHYGKLR